MSGPDVVVEDCVDAVVDGAGAVGDDAAPHELRVLPELLRAARDGLP